MVKEIILASKSGVRKKILEANNIKCKIEPSNVDEDSIKESLGFFFKMSGMDCSFTKGMFKVLYPLLAR